MLQHEQNYSGVTRISNPRTLQSWIDKGWYAELINDGFMFNVGCGRFTTEKCVCTKCRNKPKAELKSIIDSLTQPPAPPRIIN